MKYNILLKALDIYRVECFWVLLSEEMILNIWIYIFQCVLSTPWVLVSTEDINKVQHANTTNQNENLLNNCFIIISTTSGALVVVLV